MWKKNYVKRACILTPPSSPHSVNIILCDRKREHDEPSSPKKSLNPSILCFKLLLYFQWPCIEMVISNRPKYTNSSYHYRVQLIYTSTYTNGRIHMHTSTSNEYIFIVVMLLLAEWWVLLPRSVCYFLSIVRFFFFLCSGSPSSNKWDNKFMQRLACTHTNIRLSSIKI